MTKQQHPFDILEAFLKKLLVCERNVSAFSCYLINVRLNNQLVRTKGMDSPTICIASFRSVKLAVYTLRTGQWH